MAALAVAMGIGRFAFTPILPMMQAELGVSVAAGGWLASANYAGYLLGAVSTMAMRISATTAIRAGLALIGGVTVGMALTSSFAVWIGLRALAGVASAWVLVFASSWCLEKLAPLGRPVLPSAVFAGVGVGIAIAGGACVLLMEQQASPAAAWGLLGIFALIVTALTWPVFGGALGPSREPRSATPVRTWNADRVRLVLCYGTFGFGYIIPASP
ncbi:MAG: YbfB/YjiJ family MFS transporter [Candidatus Rokuibacteriota bacterium]